MNTAPTFLDTSIIIHYVHSSTFLIHRAKVRRMEMAHKFFEIYRATVYRRTSPSIQPKLKQRNVSDKPKCNEKRAQWLYIYIHIYFISSSICVINAAADRKRIRSLKAGSAYIKNYRFSRYQNAITSSMPYRNTTIR